MPVHEALAAAAQAGRTRMRTRSPLRLPPQADRDRALTEMNGVYISTRPVRVSMATARKPPGSAGAQVGAHPVTSSAFVVRGFLGGGGGGGVVAALALVVEAYMPPAGWR